MYRKLYADGYQRVKNDWHYKLVQTLMFLTIFRFFIILLFYNSYFNWQAYLTKYFASCQSVGCHCFGELLIQLITVSAVCGALQNQCRVVN